MTYSSATVSPPSSPRASDSQARLAASIVRQVQHHLPGPASPHEMASSVESALRKEGHANEVTLAYLRIAGLVALTLLSFVGYLRPELLGAQSLRLVVPIGGAAATFFALAFLWVIQKWPYTTWLRRWVPAGDALIIGSILLLMYMEPGLQEPEATPGLAALGAGACLFLTFSGLMRLSRRSQRMATVAAVLLWAVLAWELTIALLPAVAVAVMLIVLGTFGSRLTLMVRRIIAFEVERERLSQMYQSAQSAVEAREEVLRMVAHDLRNPLSTIGMTAEMLVEMPVTEEQRKKYAGTIARCGRAMNRLIQDLLDFARMEAGQLKIEPVPQEVPGLLERVVELMHPIASAASVTLAAEGSAGLPSVQADPERVTQVFSNLIGNAVKFTPAGGRVTLRPQQIGDMVRFSIIDTGPGIPPEQVSKIFGGFWQAQAGDRRGIGLGLSIARHIVEAHGGRIGVESQLASGSEFWFALPAAIRPSPGHEGD